MCKVYGCEVGVKDENGNNPTITLIIDDATPDMLPLIKGINELVGPKYAIWLVNDYDDQDEQI